MNPSIPGSKDPPDPFDTPMFMVEELDEMFETHHPFGRSETGFLAGRNFKPAANVFETENSLIVTVDIPGVGRDDIDITLEGRRLSVSGTRAFKSENPDEDYIRLERGFGRFRRIFEVPFDTDPSMISARIENGVLTIDVPGISSARTITIESDGDDT